MDWTKLPRAAGYPSSNMERVGGFDIHKVVFVKVEAVEGGRGRGGQIVSMINDRGVM